MRSLDRRDLFGRAAHRVRARGVGMGGLVEGDPDARRQRRHRPAGLLGRGVGQREVAPPTVRALPLCSELGAAVDDKKLP